MTFRVKPVDRARSDRDPNRRTLYMNIGFGVAVVVAVLILVAVGVTTWYSAHLAPAASVDGQTITKDQFNDRAAVEQFRLQQEANRINADVAAGRLTNSAAQARLSAINSALDPTTFVSTVLEKLIDGSIQAKLATDEGITITDQQIDQRITDDKTRKEERHVWLIAVEPTVDTGATVPTDAQKAAAKAKADEALAEIKAGKSWEDVAKSVSTDPSTARRRRPRLDRRRPPTEDPACRRPCSQLDANAPTDVIEGADGIYRIGRVTEIAPAEVDPAWDQKLADAKISHDGLPRRDPGRRRPRRPSRTRSSPTRAEPARSATSPRSTSRSPHDARPEGDQGPPHPVLPEGRSAERLARSRPDDPAWTQAQLAAQATYDQAQGPTRAVRLDRPRRERRDVGAGRRPGPAASCRTSTRHEPSGRSGLRRAILAPASSPARSCRRSSRAFGWHVIQVMYRPDRTATR